jgi:hypothetical protein
MKFKYTLDQRINYQITISGILNSNWSDWMDKMIVTVEVESDGSSVSTLIGTLDQAALQGLLRKLYYLGFPLISVNSTQSQQ